jgi:hypothetical protein
MGDTTYGDEPLDLVLLVVLGLGGDIVRADEEEEEEEEEVGKLDRADA